MSRKPNPKGLRRTILEFGSIVFLSDHCLSCRKRVKERKLVLIKWKTDVKVEQKEYGYLGVPVCLPCFDGPLDRESLIKRVEEAILDCPYKILIE